MYELKVNNKVSVASADKCYKRTRVPTRFAQGKLCNKKLNGFLNK